MQEYSECLNSNDSMIGFYLDILDKLWLGFSEEEIKFVNNFIVQNMIGKNKLDSQSAKNIVDTYPKWKKNIN